MEKKDEEGHYKEALAKLQFCKRLYIYDIMRPAVF